MKGEVYINIIITVYKVNKLTISTVLIKKGKFSRKFSDLHFSGKFSSLGCESMGAYGRQFVADGFLMRGSTVFSQQFHVSIGSSGFLIVVLHTLKGTELYSYIMLSTLPAIATPQCRRYKRTTSEFLRK
jgi:hypothetical protein